MKKKKILTKAISLILALVCVLSVFTAMTFSASAATANANVSEVSKITLQNAGTGQYLNFDYGKLKNGTSVRVWPKDNSQEQLWTIDKISGTTYRILTHKSTQYSLDIYRGTSSLKAGQKADIWKAGADSCAQNVTFYLCDDGSFIIRMAQNPNLALSAPKAKERVVLAKFNSSSKSQKWYVKDANGNNINITSSQSKPSASNNNWDKLAGTTVAFIKTDSSYTKWYGSPENVSANGGYIGECTWYALGRFYEVNGIKLTKAPHAKKWLKTYANSDSVTVLYGAGKIVPKSIAVDTAGTYGHVMFIEHVTYSQNGSPEYVYFTECNFDGNSRYNAGKDCILKKLPYKQFVSQRGPDGYIVAK